MPISKTKQEFATNTSNFRHRIHNQWFILMNLLLLYSCNNNSCIVIIFIFSFEKNYLSWKKKKELRKNNNAIIIALCLPAENKRQIMSFIKSNNSIICIPDILDVYKYSFICYSPLAINLYICARIHIFWLLPLFILLLNKIIVAAFYLSRDRY